MWCNRFIRRYGNGIGVDIYPWKGIDILIKDSAILPFKDNTFDTVTFIASLNHIPNRGDALKEAHRVLKNDGITLVTMINPIIGYITHKIRYIYDKDQSQRGMIQGEVWGFWKKEIVTLFRNAGFRLVDIESFVYRLNKLYIGKKR